MATKLDILEAQVGIERARLNVLQAEKISRSAEDALLALIGQFELDDAVGPTIVDDVAAAATPTPGASYARALEHQPAILNARANLELTRLTLGLAKDDLKPSLDLSLSLNLGGIDTSSRAAFSAVIQPQESSWEADLTFIYPLGRVGQKARFRQASHALLRDELAVHQLEQRVLVSIREAVRNVETSRESVKIASLAANLAQEQYDAETIRYKSGLSTSRRVLEAQADLESARVAELQSRLDLRVAFAALYRIEGSSLDRYGITLNVAPRSDR
jgi:outer membrane protein TolC